MKAFPPTLIIRHKKENLKKCSLRGLEKLKDLEFFTYPLKYALEVKGYVLLTVDSEIPLSQDDEDKGLLLLDATWAYAEVMQKQLPFLNGMEKRSLPSRYRTAYPRRQKDCPDPERGLASIEALFCAYTLLQRDAAHLLDSYYWRDTFLEKNPSLSISNNHDGMQS